MHRILLCLMTLVSVAYGAQHPHIVVLYADDMGYGEIQALNPDRSIVPTPHLDRLVSEGLTFTDGHSPASVCTPSRYALLTGRYAWRTTRAKGVGRGLNGCLIEEDRLTVAGFLRDQGYHTCMIGKWHQGFGAKSKIPRSEWPKATPAQSQAFKKPGKLLTPIGSAVTDSPVTRGFDYFFGFDNSGSMNMLAENELMVRHPNSDEVLGALTEKAVHYIHERAETPEKPFFLYLPFNSPHLPVAPSKAWQGKSELGPYGDFVMETDWAAGQVLDALRETGLLDKTLVIFTADNGFAVAGEKVNRKAREDGKSFAELGHYPSGDKRGNKADLYEGGHRVPFIVRWPEGGAKPGTRSDALVCQVDFLATFAELVGATYPDNAGEDSISVLSAFRGGKSARDQIVHHSFMGRFAIRKGADKLLFAPASGGFSQKPDEEYLKEGLPPIQLYNLTNDPAEESNVQAENPEKVETLTGLLEDSIIRGRSTPGSVQKNDRPINFRIWEDEAVFGWPEE